MTNERHTPRVSICMPVYNGLPHIETTLDSVLAQSFDDFEVLIRDDGSTDGTFDWLQQRYGSDSRFRLARNGANLDVGGQYNLLFSEARGEFILKLDADDIILPTMLERLVTTADRTGAGFVGAGYDWLEMSTGARRSPRADNALPNGSLTDPVRTVLTENPFSLCFSIFRRALLPQIQRDGQFVLFTETCDWECQLRLALTGTTFVSVDEVLGLYRLHDTNRSRVMHAQARSVIGDVLPYWKSQLDEAIGRRVVRRFIVSLLRNHLKLIARHPTSVDPKILAAFARLLIGRPTKPVWCLSSHWRSEIASSDYLI